MLGMSKADRCIYDQIVMLRTDIQQDIRDCEKDIEDFSHKLEELTREKNSLVETLKLFDKVIKEIEEDNGESASEIMHKYFQDTERL